MFFTFHQERSDQLEHILRSSVVQTSYGEIFAKHREPNLEIIREVVDSKHIVLMCWHNS